MSWLHLKAEPFADCRPVSAWFVWFGGVRRTILSLEKCGDDAVQFRDEDPYYYRIHSPVIIVEVSLQSPFRVEKS